MSEQTKKKINLWLRRWALRKLRLWFDAADDRLHTAEVHLREELADQQSPAVSLVVAPPVRAKVALLEAEPAGETFEQWEARKSGITPKPKRVARRRGISGAEFNHKMATALESAFAERG